MYQMYAADPRARINLGIRRRLAPLLENDVGRIKLMNSLLLSMPGSPILYYGDEIGMGDNIYLGDRNGVRTPMQWSPDRNAGFSRADPQRLYLPPIMDADLRLRGGQRRGAVARALVAAQLDAPHARGAQGIRGVRPRHAHVPAARQPQDPRLPARARRRDHPVRGQPRALGAAGRARPRALQGPRAGRADRPHAVSADRRAALPADARRARLLLVPARHRRGGAGVARGAPRPRRAAGARAVRRLGEPLPRPRRAVAHRDGGEGARAARARGAAVVRRRAGAGTRRRASRMRRVALADHVEWQQRRADAGSSRSPTPSARAASRRPTSCRSRSPGRTDDDDAMRALAPLTIAKVRQQAQVGVLADAFGDEAFCRALVAAIGAASERKSTHGTLRFAPTRAFARLAGDGLGRAADRQPRRAEQQHDRQRSASGSSSRPTGACTPGSIPRSRSGAS